MYCMKRNNIPTENDTKMSNVSTTTVYTNQCQSAIELALLKIEAANEFSEIELIDIREIRMHLLRALDQIKLSK